MPEPTTDSEVLELQKPAAPAAETKLSESDVAKFLAPRLEQARARERESLLKELGIDDAEKAKAMLAAANLAEQEAKSAAEKLGETNTTLSQLQKDNERLHTFNKERAERLTIGLNDSQREYIEGAIKAAGGDPQSPMSRLAMIEHMAPQWAAEKSAAAAITATASNKDTPATPASGTAPPNGAPAENTQSPQNHGEVHTALRQKNPFAAATYGLQHINDVYPDKAN